MQASPLPFRLILYWFYLYHLLSDTTRCLEWCREIQTVYNRHFFQARIYELNQENMYILSDLAKSDGNILIATIVYEMGVYNHWVKVIIHYGPSRNIETYHHKNGRRKKKRTKPVHCSNTLDLIQFHVEVLLWQLGMYTERYAIGRAYFCILDSDWRDSERPPCKPHNFCNVRLNNSDTCSFVYFPLIKSLSVI